MFLTKWLKVADVLTRATNSMNRFSQDMYITVSFSAQTASCQKSPPLTPLLDRQLVQIAAHLVSMLVTHTV